jgi:hypothetical protein
MFYSERGAGGEKQKIHETCNRLWTFRLSAMEASGEPFGVSLCEIIHMEIPR